MDAVGSMYGPVEIEVELDRGGRRARDRLCAQAHPALGPSRFESGDWIAHSRMRAARPVRR